MISGMEGASNEDRIHSGIQFRLKPTNFYDAMETPERVFRFSLMLQTNSRTDWKMSLKEVHVFVVDAFASQAFGESGSEFND